MSVKRTYVILLRLDCRSGPVRFSSELLRSSSASLESDPSVLDEEEEEEEEAAPPPSEVKR